MASVQKYQNHFNGDFEDISASLGFYNGSHCARYDEYRLFSAFQPIYSIAHKRIVGLEGLLRGVDAEGSLIPPWKLFNQIDKDNVLLLDKLCQVVHVDNFMALDADDIWLFLNVNPLSLREVESFVDYLDSLITDRKLPACRIVIEVLENETDSELALEAAISHYKELGCLIAIDDFGVGHSNFERIWRIQPDIVKFDRGMINKAGKNPSIRSMMKSIVSLLHDNSCIVLAEGIENIDEGIACMEANVDLVQGYYFCRPFMLSEGLNADETIWSDLYDQYDDFSKEYNKQIKEKIGYCRERFSEVINLDDIEAIANYMFSIDKVIRLYKIAEDGSQSFSNIVSPVYSYDKVEKLNPLLKAEGASWQHRSYFKSAIQNPGVMQTSGPYLSISDGKSVITFSMKVESAAKPYVLCCDLYWDN